MRELRGRGHGFPFPADGAARLAAEQDHSMNGTGFRLVYDNAGRVLSGSRWCGTEGNEKAARGLTRLPGLRYGVLGFRLCVDWREG